MVAKRVIHKRGLVKVGRRPEATAFPIGSVLATPLALRRLLLSRLEPAALLQRHVACNLEDRRASVRAVKCAGRVIGSYDINNSERLWIITEAERSTTTFLLPFEY